MNSDFSEKELANWIKVMECYETADNDDATPGTVDMA
jgi:hypothetical protein